MTNRQRTCRLSARVAHSAYPPHIGMCGVAEVTQRWCCDVSSSCLSKRIPYDDCVGKPQTQSSIRDISSYNNPHAEKLRGECAYRRRSRGRGYSPAVVQEDSTKWAARFQGSSSAKSNAQQRGTLIHKQPARSGGPGSFSEGKGASINCFQTHSASHKVTSCRI